MQHYVHFRCRMAAKIATYPLFLQQMKIFAFIMALMVLVLSFMPCMDDAYAMNSQNAKSLISKSGQPQEHNDTDACSPFCTCNCCTGFTVLLTPQNVNHSNTLSTEKSSFHLPSKISDIALPVWQPPQLV